MTILDASRWAAAVLSSALMLAFCGPAVSAGAEDMPSRLRYELRPGLKLTYRLVREIRMEIEPPDGAESDGRAAKERVCMEEALLDVYVRKGEKGSAEVETRRRDIHIKMPEMSRFPINESAPSPRKAMTESVTKAVENYLMESVERWRMDERGRIQADASLESTIENMKKLYRLARWSRRTAEDFAGAWDAASVISPPLPLWPVFPEGTMALGTPIRYGGHEIGSGGREGKGKTGGGARRGSSGRREMTVEAEWLPRKIESAGNRRLVSGPLGFIPRIENGAFEIPMVCGRVRGRAVSAEPLDGEMAVTADEGWPERLTAGFCVKSEYFFEDCALKHSVKVRVKMERLRGEGHAADGHEAKP